MKLIISPTVALCDERIKTFSISDLKPFSKIEVSASMYLPWAKDVKYESNAFFTADSKGLVDLSKQIPDAGTYNFADNMGLIISMTTKEKNSIKKIGENISIYEEIEININVKCGSKTDYCKLKRLIFLF